MKLILRPIAGLWQAVNKKLTHECRFVWADPVRHPFWASKLNYDFRRWLKRGRP